MRCPLPNASNRFRRIRFCQNRCGKPRRKPGVILAVHCNTPPLELLHKPAKGPEKTIRQIDPSFFIESMSINALPSLLLAKHLHAKFRHGRPAVFATVSAKVGSIEDNRLGGWFSYRASKAALNMCLKTLAIEWRRSLPNVAVAALHPGTTDTPLSRPFQHNVPTGQLFAPAQSVSYMLDVLDGLNSADSGQFLAFDGEKLPW